jgi:hypothetical protein
MNVLKLETLSIGLLFMLAKLDLQEPARLIPVCRLFLYLIHLGTQ